MAQHISEIWAGLYEAGFSEVMLFLPDNTASRCNWNETAVIDGVRVALLADQDRKIVRVLPIDNCTGIGIASPKGTDPSGYKSIVQKRIFKKFGGPNGEEYVEEEEARPEEPAPTAAAAVAPPPTPAPAPPPAPEPTAKVDPIASRWGIALKSPAKPPGYR